MISAMQTGSVGINEAAKMYEVPPTTLKDRELSMGGVRRDTK